MRHQQYIQSVDYTSKYWVGIKQYLNLYTKECNWSKNFVHLASQDYNTQVCLCLKVLKLEHLNDYIICQNILGVNLNNFCTKSCVHSFQSKLVEIRILLWGLPIFLVQTAIAISTGRINSKYHHGRLWSQFFQVQILIQSSLVRLQIFPNQFVPWHTHSHTQEVILFHYTYTEAVVLVLSLYITDYVVQIHTRI